MTKQLPTSLSRIKFGVVPISVARIDKIKSNTIFVQYSDSPSAQKGLELRDLHRHRDWHNNWIARRRSLYRRRNIAIEIITTISITSIDNKPPVNELDRKSVHTKE